MNYLCKGVCFHTEYTFFLSSIELKILRVTKKRRKKKCKISVPKTTNIQVRKYFVVCDTTSVIYRIRVTCLYNFHISFAKHMLHAYTEYCIFLSDLWYTRQTNTYNLVSGDISNTISEC